MVGFPRREPSRLEQTIALGEPVLLEAPRIWALLEKLSQHEPHFLLSAILWRPPVAVERG